MDSMKSISVRLGGGVDIASSLLGIVDLVLLLKFRVSIPKVLMVSAVVGIIMYGVIGL